HLTVGGSSLMILQPAILNWKYCSRSRKELLIKTIGPLCSAIYKAWWKKATLIPFLPILLKGDHRHAEIVPTVAASSSSPNGEPSSIEEAQDMLPRGASSSSVD
ncbi:hypothetical protein AMTR_s00043p00216400, partial [Amborella trichopoda]